MQGLPPCASPLIERLILYRSYRARSSAGEHYVDIVGVTGSIPVAPTTFRMTQAIEIAGEIAPAFLSLASSLGCLDLL